MGSVMKRLRRNVMAANMAEKAGVKMPPIRMPVDREDPSQGTFLFWSKFTPRINYRGIMLRVLRARRQRDRIIHDQQQQLSARKEKRTRKVRNEGSMVRRFFNGLFKGRSGR